MPAARLLRTSTFRLSLLYVGLFGASVLVLLAFIYWTTVRVIDRQTGATIEAEVRGLAEQYRARGIRRLIAVIEERSGTYGDPDGVYLLADAQYRPLAGNLSAWPREAGGAQGGWVEIAARRAGRRGGAGHDPRPHLRPARRLPAARRPRPARPCRLRGPDPRIPRRCARDHAGPRPAGRPRDEPQDAAPGRCRARDRPAHRARRSFPPHAGHGRRRRVRPSV